MRPQLTNRQKEVLGFIRDFTGENGYSPTVREMCDHFGIQPQAAADHINALVKKGYLAKQPMKSRSLKVIGFSRRDRAEVPIVGRVAAGEPILADENIEGAVTLPAEWVRDKDCFLVRVEGDSMVDAHICDGDYVLVRQQPTAENGDIVIALLDDEATVKRFFAKKGSVVLKPENERMKPIVVKKGDKSMRIIGKVVGVCRIM